QSTRRPGLSRAGGTAVDDVRGPGRGREAAAARPDEEALRQQPQTPRRGPAAGQRSAARRAPPAGLLTPTERTGIILDPCQPTGQVTFEQHRADTMSDAGTMMHRLSIDPRHGLK